MLQIYLLWVYASLDVKVFFKARQNLVVVNLNFLATQHVHYLLLLKKNPTFFHSRN